MAENFRIFEPEHIAELKGRLALREIIGEYTALMHKVGPWYMGNCPFCKGPCTVFIFEDGAASYYQSKGCGARGDIIGATMRLAEPNGVSYQEAVERLSEQAEIPV